MGECGGAAGDLYVDIHIKADKQFTRDGDDLHCWVRVPMSWAVLGHEIDIETFDGTKNLEVPAGCQPEDTVTLKGLGAGRMRDDGERGDLVVHVAVEIPTKLSHDADAGHVAQSSRPAAAKGKKGFFSKLKDALG